MKRDFLKRVLGGSVVAATAVAFMAGSVFAKTELTNEYALIG